MVPLDLGREHTYEDAAITTPEQRERAFWQHDHVRLYAPDVGERLAAAGFGVQLLTPLQEFGTGLVQRCRLIEADHLWLCRPRATPSVDAAR
jgi:hypothetical protein